MFIVSLPVATGDVWWPGLVVLGFLIGIISGFFGIGGGFLMTPALRIIFNIAYPVAIGSSLLQIVVTSFFSAYKHWRQNNLDPKMGAVTAVGSLVGAECGIRVLRLVSVSGSVEIAGRAVLFVDVFINSCFLILLSVVAVSMYREACKSSQSGVEEPQTQYYKLAKSCPLPPFVSFGHSDIPRLSIWVPIVLSVAVGCFTGLLGIGGGIVSLPLLIYVLGMPTRVAVGTSSLQVLLASCYGALRNIQDGNVDILLVLFMLVGSMSGVSLGVRFSKRVNVRNTRKYFAGLMAIGALVIVFDMLRKFFA